MKYPSCPIRSQTRLTKVLMVANEVDYFNASGGKVAPLKQFVSQMTSALVTVDVSLIKCYSPPHLQRKANWNENWNTAEKMFGVRRFYIFYFRFKSAPSKVKMMGNECFVYF